MYFCIIFKGNGEQMNEKNWCITFFVVFIIMLIAVASITIIIDPWFHYHAPLEFLEYPLHDQRYQNDGILRNFEYDAIITGTSMSENFKTSDFDELFGVNSVKTCFSGATYKEVNDALEKALQRNSEIRYIIRSLDISKILLYRDDMRYELDAYPWYLYDDMFLNDVEYVLNKTVIFNDVQDVLEYTKKGYETTTFDNYSFWADGYIFGEKAVMDTYDRRKEKAKVELSFTEKNYEDLTGNIQQNVVSLAKKYPDVKFYYFIPPYSIYWWDSMNQSNAIKQNVDALAEATRQILECENIHLFCFFDKYDIICDANNYKDYIHYSQDINFQILTWMYKGENQLTKENYQKYWRDIEQFYSTYEYELLFS